MLSRARELQRQGIDAVVGIVETHGRGETAALIDGLEVIPRQRIDYQGRVLEEMDIDAVLARRPRVTLNWRTATHRAAATSGAGRTWSNCSMPASTSTPRSTSSTSKASTTSCTASPASRSAKRCLMRLFNRLRDIRLVDLPQRELIERLHQSKVYLPDQAERALQSFFSSANLAVLRELAMQTAADHVEEDLRESQAARGLPGIALRRRVLIAIDGLGASE